MFPAATAIGGRGGDRWRRPLPPHHPRTASHGGRSAIAPAPCRARLRTWLAGIRELDREAQLLSGRTSCRKGAPPSRFPTAAGKESCYCLSWRDLRRRSNAGIACWTKLEITPPSISYHSPYATGRCDKNLCLPCSRVLSMLRDASRRRQLKRNTNNLSRLICAFWRVP